MNLLQTIFASVFVKYTQDSNTQCANDIFNHLDKVIKLGAITHSNELSLRTIKRRFFYS